MNHVDTPIGRLEWEGILTERTMVTIVKDDPQRGATTHEAPLSRIIAMTNGSILKYLPPPPPRSPDAAAST